MTLPGGWICKSDHAVLHSHRRSSPSPHPSPLLLTFSSTHYHYYFCSPPPTTDPASPLHRLLPLFFPLTSSTVTPSSPLPSPLPLHLPFPSPLRLHLIFLHHAPCSLPLGFANLAIIVAISIINGGWHYSFFCSPTLELVSHSSLPSPMSPSPFLPSLLLPLPISPTIVVSLIVTSPPHLISLLFPNLCLSNL